MLNIYLISEFGDLLRDLPSAFTDPRARIHFIGGPRSVFNKQENFHNEQNTTVNQNSRTENFNKSEYSYRSGDVNSTENLSAYNSFNNQEPGTRTTTQETEERINYREVTELVFTRIEEKLKTFSVTEEDIIILKHKILSEVTEIYEKRSKFDIQKSEEKMKKEVQDLFIKFLNS